METSKENQIKKRKILNYAKNIGFNDVGFTNPSILKKNYRLFNDLKSYIEKNHHGSMGWMGKNLDLRSDPQKLWDKTSTIILLTLNYGQRLKFTKSKKSTDRGIISIYAQGNDYHLVFKKKLKELGLWLSKEFSGEIKFFVDTAPVMEKPIAQAAGVGWQGKHTNLVSKTFGSWTFLGTIFTNLYLEPDSPTSNHCGSCSACLNVCPTNAFPNPYQIDSRKCISYLTIEHKGHIDTNLREAIGNRIYGCDDCLEVCPWNKFAKQTKEFQFIARKDLSNPLLKDLVRLDDKNFRKKFSKSAIKRIGRNRFVRNVLIAIGNSKSTSFVRIVKTLLDDDSSLVRAASVWALFRIMKRNEFIRMKKNYINKEQDSFVLKEWKIVN